MKKMNKMVKMVALIAGVLMIGYSVNELIIAPSAKDNTIKSECESVQERIEEATTPTVMPTPTEEVLGEAIPEEPVVELPKLPVEEIQQYRNDLNWEKTTEKDVLSYPSVGYIKIDSVGVEAAVRFGSKFKSNLDNAACITEFSHGEKMYILGHNYTKTSAGNRIFHNLLEVKEGDIISVTLLYTKDGEEIATEYKYEVVFSKRYTQDEFYSDNAAVLTENNDYTDDFNLCLATCNHDDVSRGRQVVFCKIVED